MDDEDTRNGAKKELTIFYFYVLFVPLLILVIGYLITKRKPKNYPQYVNFLLKIILYEWLYTFSMFCLKLQQKINEGWVFYTLFMFLSLITAIVLLLKILHWVKNMK